MKIDFNDDDFEVIENPQKIQEISSYGDPSFIVHYGIVNLKIGKKLQFIFSRLDAKKKRTQLFGNLEQ